MAHVSKMKNQQYYPGKEFWEHSLYFVLGLVVVCGFIVYTVVSLPIFFYRWIICEVLGPLCRKDAGKAVPLGGAVMATELKPGKLLAQTRFAIVSSVVFEGEVTFEVLRDRVLRGWINAKMANDEGLKYPELQQHIESWMGYLFWKQDTDFNLENHLVHHKCDESWTEMECENYARCMSQELLNKPFPNSRSPWEIHMISSFRNSELIPGGKEITLLVFRFHHGMGDGFAFFSAISEGLLEIPISKCTVAQPSSPKSMLMSKLVHVKSWRSILVDFVRFIITAIRELGYAGSLILIPVMTPWYIPEENRTGRQLYIRSGKIPIRKLKFVKNKFGVSFTSTVLSSVAAGVATIFRSKGFPNHLKELPLGSAVPLKGHLHKLENHWTGTILKMCTDQSLSPLERLKESEKHFQAAKRSTYPHLFLMSLKMAALQFPFISKAMTRNLPLSAGLTNFPGPGVKISGFGRNIIGYDFGAGLLYGAAGLGVMVASYVDHIRISIVAENAAMERDELVILLKSISDEIDKLYELAQGEAIRMQD